MRKILLLSALFAVAQPGLHAQPAGNRTAPALSDEQATGARIFQQKCAVCHLPILRSGDTPYASRLDGGRVAGDRAYARRVIEDGNAAGMPGWKHTLQPAQLDALMAYLVTLDGSAPPAADPAAGGSAARVLPPAERDSRLAGTVTAAAGEPLEGVTVSARRPERPITTSVFTDERGAYLFPPLESGRYEVWAQAAGWEGVRRRVALDGARERQDFILHETADFVAQLTGDQLVAALPEDTPDRRRLKAVFVGVCTECHAANVVLHNRFDERGWDDIVAAMARLGAMNTFRAQPSPVIEHFRADLAAYLAEMRGPGPSPMRFEAPPRPRGDSTLPVVYEYDLPTEAGGRVLNAGSDWSLGGPSASGGGFGLHDATVDRDGDVWYTYNEPEAATRTVGKVDTATGRVTDFSYPRADGRAATSHGIITARDGAVWFNVNLRAPGQPGNERLGRIDPGTGTLEVFTAAGSDAGHGDPRGRGRAGQHLGRHRHRRHPLRPGGGRVHRLHLADAARPHVRRRRRPRRQRLVDADRHRRDRPRRSGDRGVVRDPAPGEAPGIRAGRRLLAGGYPWRSTPAGAGGCRRRAGRPPTC